MTRQRRDNYTDSHKRQYSTCKTCPPHSNMDHSIQGAGPCLIKGCPCKHMDPGEEFIKEKYVHRSRSFMRKQAAERGAAEAPTDEDGDMTGEGK